MNHNHCPTCGAKASGDLKSTCEFCGVELAKAGLVSPQETINALKHSIEEHVKRMREGLAKSSAWDDDGTAAAVQTFPIPSDIGCLTAVFLLAHGIVRSSDYFSDYAVHSTNENAWFSCAKASYERLCVASLSNPQLAIYMEQFKATYSEEALTEKNKGCFIATACYGDYSHPVVIELRRFRDDCLEASASGRRFVRWYYGWSPALASLVATNATLQTLARMLIITPAVTVARICHRRRQTKHNQS